MANQSLYKKIYDELLEEISQGKYKEGAKVPSENELARQFGVSQITSKKALTLLAEQGVLARYPGKGSFVAGKTASRTRPFGRSNLIGLLTSSISASFGIRLVNAIEERASELGYHIIYKNPKDDFALEEEYIRALLELDVAGFLMTPCQGDYYSDEILKLILGKKPLVYFDRKMTGLAVPMAATDNIKAGEDGADYLIHLGHRKIGFLSRPLERMTSLEDRKTGFIKALRKHRIPVHEGYFLQNLDNTDPQNVKKLTRFLAEHPDITALFSTEYYFALAAKYSAEKLGRTVPKDFSILCCGNSPAYIGKPAFTYLEQDEETIGKATVETLHKLICGVHDTSKDAAKIKDIAIPATLIPGESTAPLHVRRRPGHLK